MLGLSIDENTKRKKKYVAVMLYNAILGGSANSKNVPKL